MVNKNMLRAYIVRNGDTYASLAKALGIGYSTVALKMQGKRAFSLSEIEGIANRYKIDNDDIIKIFFPNMDTKRGVEEREE